MSLFATPGVNTPHLDQLAREGMYFKNAFVAYPVCSASKSALYTGLHSHANGTVNNTVNYHRPDAELSALDRERPLYLNNRIKENIPTLIELLKQAGYYTGASNKLHVAPNHKFPFDEFLPRPRLGDNLIENFVAKAREQDRPWFLLYNLRSAHRPFPRALESEGLDKLQLPPFLPDTEVARLDWHEYLLGIEKVDQLVAQAEQALVRNQLNENTYVIFLSDHGPAFPHGKMTLYDFALRVPLILRGPSIAKNQIVEDIISEVDLMPTILDLAQISQPANLHGASFKTRLTKGEEFKRDFAFAEIANETFNRDNGIQERTLIGKQFKLIVRNNTQRKWRKVQADSKSEKKVWRNLVYADIIANQSLYPEPYRILQEMNPQDLGGEVLSVELYDLKNDPYEMDNLINQPDYAMVAANMKAMFLTELSRLNDTFEHDIEVRE